MKVAMFSDTYLPHNNGVATTLYQIHHARKEWDTEVFSPVEHKDVITVKGFPFLVYPEYKIALNSGWLEERVLDEKFDLIHNHTPYGLFYYGREISRKLELPLIGSFHTDPAAIFGAILSTESMMGGVATKLTWDYLIKLYNNCDVVIAPSEWAKEEIVHRRIKRPIEVIPNGIDTEKFSPQVDSSEFLEKYKIPEDKKIVLFCGRLQKKKDPKTFVRAALESESDAVFVIIGKGELENTLRRVSRKKESIIFTGFMPEDLLPQAFAAADIFVMPSEMETQGIVLAEALASETPCISTNVGSAKEMIPSEFIIPQKEPKILAEKIDYLLENDSERKKMARDGRKRAEERFSIDAMVSELASVYRRISENGVGEI